MIQTILARFFGRVPLDQNIFEESRLAAMSLLVASDNSYPTGTIEHKSWLVGYKKQDDWDYVW